MEASLPRPPKVGNTNGVKEADSTLQTVLMFLFKFMSTEQKAYLSLAVARCVGIKHPNIEKCILLSTPKTSGMDI